MAIQFFYFVFTILLLESCGSQSRDRENYGELDSSGAIILDSPEKHMGGYGRNECLVCHNIALNVHRREASNIDVDDLNTSIKNGGEAAYCLRCHGNN